MLEIDRTMTPYKINVTRSPDWQRHADGILAISVGKEYHEGSKFFSTIAWATDRFQRLHLLVADTLQRHNDPAPDAKEKALAAGDAWLKTYRPALEKTGKLCSITRWNDLLRNPCFPETLTQFKQAAAENASFREAIRSDVKRFLDRQTTLRPDSAERSEAYLLEELAAVTLHARQQKGARLYPSENLESFRLVEAGLIGEAPRGLENQQRVELHLRKRKGFVAEFPGKPGFEAVRPVELLNIA